MTASRRAPIAQWLCCVATLGLMLSSEPAIASNTALDSHVSASSQALQRFSSSRSLSDLRAAVVEMETALQLDSFPSASFVSQRRTLVRGWAAVVKTIEGAYDPTYDFNNPSNRPQWGLPDPNSITDPSAHAQAVAAVAANDVRIKKAAYYHDLSVLDATAQAALQNALDLLRSVEPEGTSADFPALDAILRQSGMSSARRAKIDALFYSRGGSAATLTTQ